MRDEDAKAGLQAEIGDVALVLTILQSKGMEFDDVILWDFFTGCPYPASVRCLGALVKGVAGEFDAKKHVVGTKWFVCRKFFYWLTGIQAMCSDLKVNKSTFYYLSQNADYNLQLAPLCCHYKSSHPTLDY